MIGGLFTSVSAIAIFFVGFFTRGRLGTSVLRNLFLTRNTAHLTNESKIEQKAGEAFDEKTVATHSTNQFI